MQMYNNMARVFMKNKHVLASSVLASYCGYRIGEKKVKQDVRTCLRYTTIGNERCDILYTIGDLNTDEWAEEAFKHR